MIVQEKGIFGGKLILILLVLNIGKSFCQFQNGFPKVIQKATKATFDSTFWYYHNLFNSTPISSKYNVIGIKYFECNDKDTLYSLTIGQIYDIRYISNYKELKYVYFNNSHVFYSNINPTSIIINFLNNKFEVRNLDTNDYYTFKRFIPPNDLHFSGRELAITITLYKTDLYIEPVSCSDFFRGITNYSDSIQYIRHNDDFFKKESFSLKQYKKYILKKRVVKVLFKEYLEGRLKYLKSKNP